MRIRAILAVVLCNVIAFLLLSIAAFLFIRFTTSGHLVLDMSKAPPAEIASKYGDPFALLDRGLFYVTWVVAPTIAFLVGAVAALILRRSDWLVSTLSVVPVVGVLAVPRSAAGILNGSLYIAMSWLAMKLVSSLIHPSAPIAAAVPIPQKRVAHQR